MTDIFEAGATVKKSGIYSVVHDRKHAEDHEVTCVAGREFPPCNQCGGAVRFLLVRPAKHVNRNEYFMR
jgi:hypothetical protein